MAVFEDLNYFSLYHMYSNKASSQVASTNTKCAYANVHTYKMLKHCNLKWIMARIMNIPN